MTKKRFQQTHLITITHADGEPEHIPVMLRDGKVLSQFEFESDIDGQWAFDGETWTCDGDNLKQTCFLCAFKRINIREV